MVFGSCFSFLVIVPHFSCASIEPWIVHELNSLWLKVRESKKDVLKVIRIFHGSVLVSQGNPQALAFFKDNTNSSVKEEITVNDIIKLVEDLTRIH